MTETLGCDLDLLHPSASEVVAQTQPLSFSGLCARAPHGLHNLVISEDLECLFERLEVVRTEQHERGAAVTGDENAFMLALDSIR